MGYKRGGRRHTLTWAEGSELHGLVVQVKSLSVEGLLQLAGLAAKLTAPDVTPAEQAAQAPALFAEFSKRLVQWNLEEDDGTPVPATAEGVAAQDFEFVLQIVLAWMEAVASVGSPLPNGSQTAPPPGLSIPMEPLPASPSN